MTREPFNVLFLCTGNSARSIIAESLLTHWGQAKFRAFSAGSHPQGMVQPVTLALLTSIGSPTQGLRSKNWAEFTAPGAPEMDFIFTLCDQEAGEVCPAWPGQPITAHWGLADPDALQGPEMERVKAYRETLRALDNRIKIFTLLPFGSLGRMALERRIAAIGPMEPDAIEEPDS